MANLHEAIYALNPTVVTIRGDVAYTADEQVVEYDKAAAEAKVAELIAAEEAAAAAAVAKLAALGLTEAEVKALIG